MKKAIIKSIEISFWGMLFLLTSFSVLAQPTVVEPGDKSINTSLINTGNFTRARHVGAKGFSHSVQRKDREITIDKQLIKNDGVEIGRHTIVLNAKTLEAIRESFTNEDRTVNLQYTGSRVKGIQTVFETNKKQNIDEAFEGKTFLTVSLPYLISSLPLSLDYRANFRVMHFDGAWKPNYFLYRISDIKEDTHWSCVRGYRDVWVVTLDAKTRKHKMIIWIEKSTRRIMRWEESLDGLHLESNIYAEYDRETDINPIKVTFNPNEATAMISGGTSTIKGQAFTKRYDDRRIFNKTEYASKGSIVTLIPNTAYYKEWLKHNVGLSDQNKILAGTCHYPLPSEVKDYTLVTDVIDNKGNFVFQNVNPGEYFLIVTFEATKYSRTTRTPNGNYTITVSPDGSSGSVRENVSVRDWFSVKQVTNVQFVKVSQAGETVSIKLDK